MSASRVQIRALQRACSQIPAHTQFERRFGQGSLTVLAVAATALPHARQGRRQGNGTALLDPDGGTSREQRDRHLVGGGDHQADRMLQPITQPMLPSPFGSLLLKNRFQGLRHLCSTTHTTTPWEVMKIQCYLLTGVLFCLSFLLLSGP